MEPEPKRLKHSIENDDFEAGELSDSNDENVKSSTPKKSVYLAGIELVCQGPKNGQSQSKEITKEKKDTSPTKRKASCPVILPFLPALPIPMTGAGLPPIPLPMLKLIKSDKPVEPSCQKEDLKKAYETNYSDENPEASDQESEQESNVESKSMEEATTIVETVTDEGANRTVIENPKIQSEPLDTSIDTKDRSFELFTKEIVKHRGGSWIRNTEPLPEGWTIINHHCGFPLYFHKDSRVITWSRPYYIGSSSVKNHKVPQTAIPCMAYLKREPPNNTVSHQNVNETNDDVTDERAKDDNVKTDNLSGDGEMCPIPKVDAQMVKSDLNLIESKELKDYISKRFEYSEITGKKYKDHSAYKQHLQHKKEMRKKSRGNKKRENHEKTIDEDEDQDLPSIAKNFIEVKVPDRNGVGKRTVLIFLSGKATVSVLNEYCSRALRCTPNYDLIENSEDAIHKDHKTYRVRLPDGQTYGTGTGPNVQAAKNVAALETLKQLIPGFEPDDKNMLTGRAEEDIAYFDHVKITDRRIHQLSQQVGLTPPYQFFMDIQHKHQGPQSSEALDIHVFQDEKKGGGVGTAHWTFTFQGISISGLAKSKKNGKHIAAQHMLAKLNPELSTWGEILKKYKTVVSKREKKEKNNDEETITQLFKVKAGPNTALLKKLREMMKRVSDEQSAFLAQSDHIQPLFTEKRSQIPIDN